MPDTNPPNRDRPDAYAAFREPAFRRFTLGMLLVQIGTGAQSLAIQWEIYQRTDSELMLGFVGLVQAVPMLLFTLPAGYFADVFDRRKLMLLGMTGTTLTSLALATFSYLAGSIAVMFVLLFLDSTALRLTGPARTALVPLLVPHAKLENAMKWRTSLGQIAAVVGPALGGLIIMWSVPLAYVVSAASTGLFMGLLMTIHVPDAARAAPGRMIAQVREGLAFVWQRKVLLGTISLDLFAVLLGGAVYLLPVYVTRVIELDGTGLSEEQALGWLKAAPAVGAMLMALWLAHSPPIRKAGRTMLWAVAGFGVAIVVFGLSRNLWLSLAMLFLTGAFDNISVVVRHTLVQLLTPNELRGRVSSVSAIFIGSSNELGGFRAGAVAAVVGPMASVVAGGVGTLLVVGTWAGLFPKLRQFGTLSGVVAEQAEKAPATRRQEAPVGKPTD
ncbi:MAG: MFS transporter [Phycisphaeraceae bacterium]